MSTYTPARTTRTRALLSASAPAATGEGRRRPGRQRVDSRSCPPGCHPGEARQENARPESVQPEVLELEARRDHAADQDRRAATRYRRLPDAARHPGLRTVTGLDVSAQQHHLAAGGLVAGTAEA